MTLRVLVVDDQVHIREVMKLFVEEAGMTCLLAASGEEALQRVAEDDPDVVLMDVVMPGMDGLEATRRIKAMSPIHRPVIFMTGLSEDKALTECLACGGDDFVTKDVDPVILTARIRAHGRTRALALEAHAQKEELADLNRAMESEMALAGHVIERVSAPSATDIPGVTCFTRSMTGFNGDLVLSARRPLGGWYVFVGDFTGHGLPASVGALPASQVFFAMTAKQFPAGDIAREMNRALVHALPDFMFCAAAVAEMLEDGRTIRLWHGGLPDIVWRRQDGNRTLVESRHMPLGILSVEQFDASTQDLVLGTGDQLLLMTDGLIETSDASGEMYGMERLCAALPADSWTLEDVLGPWQAFVGSERRQDDVSLAIVTAMPQTRVIPEALPRQAQAPWDMQYHWTADALREHPDPVTAMVDLIPLPWCFSQHKGNIKVILTELFSNALEHGLLGLDSALKASEEGMVQYYEARERRLAELRHGKITVRLTLAEDNGRPVLMIRQSDTGRGFDTGGLKLDDAAARLERGDAFGRGLLLVAALCSQLAFADGGRTVKAIYPLM